MAVDPRGLAECFYDAFNRGDLDEAVTYFADNCHHHEPVRGRITRPQFRANLEALKEAFPDGKMNVESAMARGRTVVVEGRFTGTHSGPLRGPNVEFPPTERQLKMRFADFFTVQRDQIVSHRVYYNQLDLVEQLRLL